MCLAALVVAAGCTAPRPSIALPGTPSSCVPVGRWINPRTGYAVALPDVVEHAASARVILLGEDHDRAAHHRWQANLTAAIAGRVPRVVLGLEMFPRRVQPALDRWGAGDTNEARFLIESDWDRVWGFDFALYRPLLELAHMHRIALRALNIERGLVRRVATVGWASVPDAEREGVPTPSPASPAYRTRLTEAWRAHQPLGRPADDAALDRFVEAQLVWDASMAAAIRAALDERPDTVVVAIVGRGHAEYGAGIAAQLRAMGVPRPFVLVPWGRDRPCTELDPDVADFVFGLDDDPVANGDSDSEPR